MTKQDLLTRQDELKKQFEENLAKLNVTQALLNQLQGAYQEIQRQIDELDKEAPHEN